MKICKEHEIQPEAYTILTAKCTVKVFKIEKQSFIHFKSVQKKLIYFENINYISNKLLKGFRKNSIARNRTSYLWIMGPAR